MGLESDFFLHISKLIYNLSKEIFDIIMFTHYEGYPIYPNQLTPNLDDELKLANDLRVYPIKGGDSEFDQIINAGTIKWAVTSIGELVIIPKFVDSIEIAHTVLTGGQPVLAAGEAEIVGGAGVYWGLEINNHSGHFRPSLQSLEIGKELFKELGVLFD